MAVLSVALVVAAVVDDRVVTGAPVWFKPLKFALSFTLYAGALAWLISRVDLRGRLVGSAGWFIVGAIVVEQAIITGQAARGTTSHFNDETGLDVALYSVMGATIAVLYVATLGIAVAALRKPGAEPLVVLAVRAGLGIALVGMAVGGVMVAVEAHTLGAPDGGPGLPFVGWSTTGGDLRVGHFIGMHALQVVPLVAAALTLVRRWDDRTRLRLVAVFAAAYLGLVVLVTGQALRGQPLLEPDLLTLGALVLLVGASGAATASALRGSGR